ncbi:MAG: chromate transporter [Treponema sp.]|nr:chromate transporter [Treponema sp.]
MKEDNKVLKLLKLYFVFAKIGSLTFGGGLAMMPMMQRELIQNRGWITEEDLIDYYAVGQSTPGIVAVNVSTFVGFRQCGIIGGIVATLGMVTPSLVIIMLLAKLINSISDYPIIQKALKGINVAVAALLTSVIVNFAKKTIKNVWNVIFMLISFALVFFLKVPSFYIIIAAIAIGLGISIVNQRKLKKIEEVNKPSESDDNNGGEK